MSKEMVISANPHETRVAILEEGQLCEYYVEREKEFALVGSIYKGKVTRVLPGMQSAFVEIGLDSDAFLYVSDFLEEIEGFDHVTADDKSTKPGPSALGAPAGGAPMENGGESGITALEGESLSGGPAGDSLESQPPASYVPSPIVARPSSNPPHQDRPRFENRGAGGDRNRGFNRRGGRNRHGGRGRGPGGGSGGAGRSSDRRFGRDLPSSKYASPRSFDEPAADPNTPAGHISMVLPGESISKFRSRGDASETAATAALPYESAPESFNAAPAAEAHDNESQPRDLHNEVQHDVQPGDAQPGDDQPREPRRFGRQPREHRGFDRHSGGSSRFRPSEPSSSSSSGSGLEPLPGESISKWKAHAHLPPDPVDETPSASASHVDEVEGHLQEGQHDELGLAASRALDEIASNSPQESSHHEDVHQARYEEEQHDPDAQAAALVTDDHAGEQLSEEEAAALAEHIAEAQEEQSALESHGHEHDAHEHDAHHEGNHEEQRHDDEHDDAHPDLREEASEMLSVAEADIDPEGAPEPHEIDESFEARAEALMAPDSLDAEGISSEGGEHAEEMLSAEGAQPQSPDTARVRNDFRSRMNNPARRGGRDRGGRRDHRHGRPHHGHSGGHHRSGPPRKIQLIADMLKQGQEIIVQIAKEPLGKKGARITSHVALPGRFLVYMPTLDHTGVSRKIASAEERARLRHLVNDAKGSSGGGFIVRTAAASAAPEDVRADVEFLTRTWGEIKARSESKKAPSILHRDLNLVERILRDFVTPDFGAIWVDSEEGYTKVVDFMSRFQPQLVNRVKLYTKQTPVFEEFGIQQEIDKGLRPKVWLKSGGYIVINHTEALVAIDVNTGKFVGKGSNRLEDTIVRTNVEAVKEIVRQMRLRDLGGIIVIDFIDMEERRNRDKVMAALEDALRADRAPSKVLRFNEFGLVAITRKRTKQALERTLCQPCPYCTGSGMVKSIATLCYEIQTEAVKMAPEMPSASLTLRVHPEISKALKTRESSLIEELERWTKKSVIIQADPTLHWEQYDIY
ncbi:MAG: Rne/Rng family ribonuclease [Candidatus Acidiferrales bacterium]